MVWAGGAVLFGARLVVWATRSGVDFERVRTPAVALLTHAPLYLPGRVGYPPSQALLFLPLALLPEAVAKAAFFALDSAAIVAGAYLSLRLLGLDWRGLAGALTLVGLSLFGPVSSTLNVANVNGIVLLLEAASLLVLVRGRDLAGGLLLGFSFAVKPVLFGLLGAALLKGRRRAGVLAILLPVLVSAAVLPFAVGGGGFVSRVVPSLLGGNRDYADTNVSLAGAGDLLGLPPAAVLAGRILFVGLLGLAMWRRAGRGPEALEWVELSGLGMVAMLVVSPFAFAYYGLFLLPLLVSIAVPGSLLRNPVAVIGVVLLGLHTTLVDGGPLDLVGYPLITLGYVLVGLAMAVPLLLRAGPRGPTPEACAASAGGSPPPAAPGAAA